MLIEYVRDGASFRSVILDSFNYINLSLAGIACPRVNATAKTATGRSISPDLTTTCKVTSSVNCSTWKHPL